MKNYIKSIILLLGIIGMSVLLSIASDDIIQYVIIVSMIVIVLPLFAWAIKLIVFDSLSDLEDISPNEDYDNDNIL